MMNVWDGNEGVYLEKESFRMPWDARRISIVSETSEPRDPHKLKSTTRRATKFDALTPLTLTPLHFTPFTTSLFLKSYARR